jgi:hypothetical protein
MRLRLRQFELRAKTVEGSFGVSLPFSPGLVVLRGDNSSGKSTSLQGILYALGLEGMLSPSRAVPLPHVATASLSDESGGRELVVLESYVTLEFENEAGRIATVRRYAKHASIDTQLITVWDGPVLTSHVGGLHETAYFVRRPGSAQRAAGFHHWLTGFVGWQLPEVVRYDGDTCPLYLETIFPLFFVEQKRGWAGVQAQTPTYFRIRDVGRRNVEFVLNLSGGDVAAQRQALRERLTALRQQWATALAAFRSGANEHGIGVRGVPEEPVTAWPVDPGPSLWLAATDEWLPLGAEIQRLNDELAQLTARLLPKAEDVASDVSAGLQRDLNELHEVSGLADALLRELAIEEDQIRSLDSRVASLQDDVRRSQDAEILRKMGAPMSAVSPPDCPTCHQELPSTLLDPATAIVPMPIERNTQLLKEQIALFEAMKSDLSSAVTAKEQQIVVIDERVRVLQQSVRAERETLVSAKGSPSIDEVERRVHLRDRVEALAAVAGRLSNLNATLSQLAATWTELLHEQTRLQDHSTPEMDQAKLAALQASFLEQLDAYGFTSLPTSQLAISQDTYLPIYEGFDLGFDLSASDMVRTIWAHRMGLLEVARSFENNHAHLLVFDEPRQQSTDPVSFTALLSRASQTASSGQQVIFATSEPEDAVLEMLRGLPHQYIGFVGKMIQRLNR